MDRILEKFKRKFRWTVEGRNNNEVVFPETFVKLSHHPSCPIAAVGDENGGHMEFVPGELHFDVIGAMFDTKLEADESFHKLSRASETTIGFLKLYDGCGSIVNQWQYEGVKLDLIAAQEYDDGYDLAYVMKYERQYEWIGEPPRNEVCSKNMGMGTVDLQQRQILRQEIVCETRPSP